MRKLVARLARELNWSRRRWSAAADQAFHEQLYSQSDYDPFSLAYPGYTTIRRFADLVEPHLPTQGNVLDLGCGPGEITCELAARKPHLMFVGVDHSHAAIAKADRNAARRQLKNIQFQVADVEQYEPDERLEIVTLFDSFHHLTNPARFVNRLASRVSRWVLIEPRGSWAGRWQKDFDFDWVAHDLEKIRAHIAYAAGARSHNDPAESGAKAKTEIFEPRESGAAVERRYTLDDFQRFFSREGFALDLRGTVAGLESYPPGVNANGALREQFGELQYQLYRDVDEWLFSHNLDLHAKHWLIVAARGGRSRDISMAERTAPASERQSIAGPYDVRYGRYRGPHEARPGELIVGTVEVTNEGWNVWSSQENPAVFTSYHWLDADRRIVEFDGQRTPLPKTIGAGDTSELAVTIRAPAARGRYLLAIDLVCENVTWFSQAGRPWLEIPFQVQ